MKKQWWCIVGRLFCFVGTEKLRFKENFMFGFSFVYFFTPLSHCLKPKAKKKSKKSHIKSLNICYMKPRSSPFQVCNSIKVLLLSRSTKKRIQMTFWLLNRNTSSLICCCLQKASTRLSFFFMVTTVIKKEKRGKLKYPRRVNILKKTVINNQTKNQILYYWIKSERVYIRNLWVVIHVDQIALFELNWQISKDRFHTLKRWMNVNQWMYLCVQMMK